VGGLRGRVCARWCARAREPTLDPDLAAGHHLSVRLRRCLFSLLLLGARPARADGAFPDELQLFLPAGTDRIVVSTNFGLLRSVAGGPFDFICEAAIGATGNVGLYQASADGTILAEAGQGLYRSSDWGCGWSAATGSVAGLYVYDAALDPTPSPNALAIGLTSDGGVTALYPSADEGASFTSPTLVIAGSLAGVEFSAVTPGTVFAVGNATAADGGTDVPFVSASADHGQSWPVRYDHPELAGRILRLAQVDPVAVDTLYLRVSYPTYDELWVSRDGGRTLQKLFAATEALSAFLAAADGTLYAGTRNGGLYSAPASAPGGFALVNGSVHPRCLGERGGTLYACGDDFKDGFALGSSGDRGRTFADVVRFDQIAGLASCPAEPAFAETCAFAWQTISRLFGDAGTTGGTKGSSCGGCASGSDGAWVLGLPLALWGITWGSRSRSRSRAFGKAAKENLSTHGFHVARERSPPATRSGSTPRKWANVPRTSVDSSTSSNDSTTSCPNGAYSSVDSTTSPNDSTTSCTNEACSSVDSSTSCTNEASQPTNETYSCTREA